VRAQDPFDHALLTKTYRAIVSLSCASHISERGGEGADMGDFLSVAMQLQRSRRLEQGGAFLRYPLSVETVQNLILLYLGGREGARGVRLQDFRTLPRVDREEGFTKGAGPSHAILDYSDFSECGANLADVLGTFYGAEVEAMLITTLGRLSALKTENPDIYSPAVLVSLVEVSLAQWVDAAASAARRGEVPPRYAIGGADCPVIKERVVERRQLLVEAAVSRLTNWPALAASPPEPPKKLTKPGGPTEESSEGAEPDAGSAGTHAGGATGAHPRAEAECQRADDRMNAGPLGPDYRAATRALVARGLEIPPPLAGRNNGRGQVCYRALTQAGCPHPGKCNMHHVTADYIRGEVAASEAVEVLHLLSGGFKGVAIAKSPQQRRERLMVLETRLGRQVCGGATTWDQQGAVPGCYPHGGGQGARSGSVAEPDKPLMPAPACHAAAVSLSTATSSLGQSYSPASVKAVALARDLLRGHSDLRHLEERLAPGMGRVLEGRECGPDPAVRHAFVLHALRQMEAAGAFRHQPRGVLATIDGFISCVQPLALARAGTQLIVLEQPQPLELGGTTVVRVGPHTFHAVETGELALLPTGQEDGRACVYLSLACGLLATTAAEVDLSATRAAAGQLKTDAAALALEARIALGGVVPESATSTGLTIYELLHDLQSPDHAVDPSVLAYLNLPQLESTLVVVLHVRTTASGASQAGVDTFRGLAYVEGKGRVVWLFQLTTEGKAGRSVSHMRPMFHATGTRGPAPPLFVDWAAGLLPVREFDCVGYAVLMEQDRGASRPCAATKCVQCRQPLGQPAACPAGEPA
jgi:hypothetical protein